MTYSELHRRVLRLANGLQGLGVRRGDRVAYLGPNHPSLLETLFATGLLGGVFVPLNTRLTAPEIEYQLTDSGSLVLVHATSHQALVQSLPAESRVDLPLTGSDGPDYENLVNTAPERLLDDPVTPQDICMIMYTSGTTGNPKGAALTHGNITWNAVNVLIDNDLTKDEVALLVAPLFHTASLNTSALPVLLKGGTCIVAPAFDPDITLDLIERHRVTSMFGVPTMFQQITRSARWDGVDLSSLRSLISGGSPLQPSLVATYHQRGLTLQQGYGMTETAPGSLLLDAAHAVTKAGSAGVPVFFTDVRIVGPDLADVPPGEVGEILVRGPNVMPGYWKAPEETAQVFTDDWFHTGDAAWLDEDGYAHIVDRVQDLIISGGENVYPAEVERAILDHPDVMDCAVIGVPDDTWGEAVRAIVVPRNGSDLAESDLVASLTDRLAGYKIPRSVVLSDSIPRNTTGKILKHLLRSSHGTSPNQGSTADKP